MGQDHSVRCGSDFGGGRGCRTGLGGADTDEDEDGGCLRDEEGLEVEAEVKVKLVALAAERWVGRIGPMDDGVDDVARVDGPVLAEVPTAGLGDTIVPSSLTAAFPA